MANSVRPDSTLDLLREGYLFGMNRFDVLGTDAFHTRIVGRPITVIRGVAAARFFYEADRFTRQGALPTSVVHSLQDEGSVQTLDGPAHRGRKRRFTTLFDQAGCEAMVEYFEQEWRSAQRSWQGTTVEFLPAVNEVLLNAVITWLQLDESHRKRAALTAQIAAMVDGAGAFGPRNWWGRLRRRSTERWARATVRSARSGTRGKLSHLIEGLDDDVAAVELLNVVRPVVAVGRFIGFAVLALHDGRLWRQEIPRYPRLARPFAQEVRRLSPFFPFIAGTARADTNFEGMDVKAGDWVMLDLFATNHHPQYWQRPWTFDPKRYERESPEAVVAQGAGPIATTHRCPGEPATVDLLERAVQLLSEVYWDLPEQPLRTDLSRFPANPGGNLLVSF